MFENGERQNNESTAETNWKFTLKECSILAINEHPLSISCQFISEGIRNGSEIH